ncbi:MAG: NAD-binding protein, partial [Parvibaculaceae bacterium]
GVSLTTIPYALDVTATVTALRDFFITLFFVGLGMMVAIPTSGSLDLVAALVVFTLVSRPLTMLPPLLWMRNGLRASLLPVINLAQMSEFSLVLIQLGLKSGQIQPETATAGSVAFVILAILSSFVMLRSDPLARKAIIGLKYLGVRDLSDDAAHKHEGEEEPEKARILLLGFFRTASSLLSELEQRKTDLVDQLCVVDFNPLVFRTLKDRGVKVVYGDIAHLDTLAHAGLAEAEIVISTVPDSLLKGTTNAKLVRQIRGVNPQAKIIATAEVFSEAEHLYEAGADFVSIARLAEASDLIEAIFAADDGLLDQLRLEAEPKLRDRGEVLP